jgi:hypothetical protein
MPATSFWQWVLIVLLATVVANGFIARAKSRSVIGWVILGLMFNPIPFVILLFLPSRTIPTRAIDSARLGHER